MVMYIGVKDIFIYDIGSSMVLPLFIIGNRDTDERYTVICAHSALCNHLDYQNRYYLLLWEIIW